MDRSVWDAAAIDQDIQDIVSRTRLDYRAGPSHEHEGDGSLPPAWDVDVESYAVGYEPVGETSIGTESERRVHTRFSSFRMSADRLAELNEGRHHSDGTLSARLARLDKKRITQAYCSLLGVTSFQRDEAVRAMLHLDLDDFGRQKRLEKVALTVIRVVVNYNRFAHLHDLDADRISETEQFKRLASDVALDTRSMTRLSKRIKEELRAVGYFDRDTDRLRRKQVQFRDQTSDETKQIGEDWPFQTSD